ncbi:hypothetical protein HYW59_04950 [Candidatus Kaiserbacteria bacterium]|nr:hypothetical protein [Candidatus Kaiserbacteria bacterium]
MRDNPRLPTQHDDTESERIRSSEELRKIYDDFLKAVGFDLTLDYLVGSNVVATIAGARPMTEFSIADPSENADEIIKRISTLVPGVLIRDLGQHQRSEGARSYFKVVQIINLNALERVTHNVPLKHFPQYSPATGEEGIRIWRERARSVIEEAAKSGEIPVDPETCVRFVDGIERGYPVTAIVDAMQALMHEELRNLPVASPEGSDGTLWFNYAQGHENHPDIVGTLRRWEKVLKDFAPVKQEITEKYHQMLREYWKREGAV